LTHNTDSYLKQRRRRRNPKKKLKICRFEKGAGRNKSEKKEKELKLCLRFFLFLQVTTNEERKKGGSHSRPTPSTGFSCGGAWVHAPPVAATRGVDAPPLFRQFQKAFPAILGFFGFIL
jgi:hypothetical protein